jgi:hypothetical protein
MRILNLFLLCMILSPLSFPSTGDQSPEGADNVPLQTSFAWQHLCFIENRGQADKEVLYYLHGAEKTLSFTEEGVIFSITRPTGPSVKKWIVTLDFEGANRVVPRGEDKIKGRFSYFHGKSEEWKTGIPAYGKIVYEDLWPGIDLVYHGTKDALKYEFIVAPGADPKRIRMVYRGATEICVTKSGALSISTPIGGFLDGEPFAYQERNGVRKDVPVAYGSSDHPNGDACHLEFQLGDHDPALPLVIDPAIWIYSGFIGGISTDWCGTIAVDQEGCAYVTGVTASKPPSFPVKVGPDLTFNGHADAFVAKVDAQGKHLVYCGFIGGKEMDGGNCIAVDSLGRAYVTGTTWTDDGTFPVKTGPDLTFNGLRDGFIVRVNAQGTDLDYCGFIGGDGYDLCGDVDVDSDGNAYIAGTTESAQSTFPVKTGPDLTHNGGGGDAYAAKVRHGNRRGRGGQRLSDGMRQIHARELSREDGTGPDLQRLSRRLRGPVESPGHGFRLLRLHRRR